MSDRWARRLMWGVSGFAWFIWLGIEDRTIYFVLALAVLIVASAVITLPVRTWRERFAGRAKLLATALIGPLTGVSVPMMAVLLMFVKVSLHSHATPDFSWQQVQSMLAVAPVWALAGLLAAGAWWLLDPGTG